MNEKAINDQDTLMPHKDTTVLYLQQSATKTAAVSSDRGKQTINATPKIAVNGKLS
jgi:hypothetical protein